MVKLGIYSNFSHPHEGGSEQVLKNISERMVSDYNFDVTSFSYSTNNSIIHKNVKYEKCPKGQDLINNINNFDIIYVYSDSFWGWPTILDNINSIKPKIFLAPVGMYDMLGNPERFEIFKNNINKFQIITHSDTYQDYKTCIDNNFPIKVIPNGVNIEEFDNNGIDFREKYHLENKKILLSVGNFFYAKGQEYLPDIGLELIRRCFKNFIFVLISSSIKYPYEKLFMDRCFKKFESTKVPYLSLRNIPREDVVAAFKHSDAFVFPSRKEVAPIVILESMAASLPWAAVGVGNIPYLEGGERIEPLKIDEKGYKVLTLSDIHTFASVVDNMANSIIREAVGKEGRKEVEEKYNWKKICKQYYEIFTS